MLITLQFLREFSCIISILFQPGFLCDLYTDIYGGHQNSHKHIKEFLHTEKQSLRDGCRTCGQGLHLQYLPRVYLENSAAVCKG